MQSNIVSSENKKQPDLPEFLDMPLFLWRQGYNIMPIFGHSKKKPRVKWKRYQTERISDSLLDSWVSKWSWDGYKYIGGTNYGLLTGPPPIGSSCPGLVVIDTDNPAAEAVVAKSCPETPWMQLTGGGGRHRVYRYPEGLEIRNRQGTRLGGELFKIDIRGAGGYILCPGSIHPRTGKAYVWDRPWSSKTILDCPVYSPLWLPHEGIAIEPEDEDEQREIWEDLPHDEQISCVCKHIDLAERYRQAKHWLRKCPGTQKGNNAQNKCFGLAFSLLYGFALPVKTAQKLLSLWGEQKSNVDEHGYFYPWTAEEIRTKIQDASCKPYNGELGDMLHAPPRHSLLTPSVWEQANAVIKEVDSSDFILYKGAAPVAKQEEPTPTAKADKAPKETDSQVLRRLVQQDSAVSLWHTDKGEAWLSYGERNLLLDARTQELQDFLVGLYLKSRNDAPSPEGMAKACLALRSDALGGDEFQVFKRVARVDDRIFVDLANGKTVEITASGWQLLDFPPVKFRRTSNTKELPIPVRGRSLDALRGEFQKLLATTDEHYWLAIGAILDAYKGYGEYFVTVVNGKEGSAKSSLCRLLRRLCDPLKEVELSSLPTKVDAFAVDSVSEHLLCYDNVSALPNWLSNDFCIASTGGGLKKRKLYADGSQYILSISNPVVLNGIPDFLEFQDLLSRCLLIYQESIPESQKLESKQIAKLFDAMLPELLGAIFSALANGLARHSEDSPVIGRMVASERWIRACLGSDEFHTVYSKNLAAGKSRGLEASPIFDGVMELIRLEGGYEGTAGTLLQKLNCQNPDSLKNPKFPKSPRAMSNQLKEQETGLLTIDVIVTRRTSNGRDLIKIATGPKFKPEG